MFGAKKKDSVIILSRGAGAPMKSVAVRMPAERRNS
jgi:predicted alpha/beta-hydrolase family hydrolase